MHAWVYIGERKIRDLDLLWRFKLQLREDGDSGDIEIR